MNYKVLTIPPFDKQFKKLAKKYPSLKSEIATLIGELKDQPDKGIPLGNECYKIKQAIASKAKGKSGGSRVITYFAVKDASVFLLSIYDKSDQSDIEDKELIRLLKIVK